MANDYSKLSKEELLKVVEKLESRKKYGLIWDEERTKEQFEKESENALPVLKEVKGKEIKTDPSKPVNILIEGDNYHALSVLNCTHQNRVDFIYIDPPYNTGARDWKYNNAYVDKSDTWRHSKWLSFLRNRLRLAKMLLKDDGIICVTIDDYEMPRLWLLMDEIFGESNHLGTLVIRNNPKGRKTERKLSLIHEYALFFGKSEESFIKKLEVNPEDKTHNYKQDDDGNWYLPVNLRKQGVDSLATLKSGKISERYYPIYYDPKTGRISTKHKYSVEILPIDSKGAKRIWRRSKDVIDEMFDNGELWYKKTKNGHQVYYKFYGGLDGEPPQSIWLNSLFSASEHGTQTLDRILGKRELFPYPKSPFAVGQCIKISTLNKNAIVLDFFAGSGTTLHSILELNKNDNGLRKCILVTNNENNICDEVCYPRVKNVINGYKFTGKDKHLLFEKKLSVSLLSNENLKKEIENIHSENENKYHDINSEITDGFLRIYGVNDVKDTKEGLGGNLKYFKTAFVKKGINRDSLKLRITRECTEMLCLREGIFDEVKKTDDYRIFEHNDRIMGVYYSLERVELKSLKKDLDKLTGKKILYCFTLDPLGLDKKDFRDWKGVSLEPIPQKILDIYEGIYEY